MLIYRASDYKRYMDKYETYLLYAESRRDDFEAVTALLNQIKITRKNVSNFMTFHPDFYRKLQKIDIMLSHRRRMISSGVGFRLDLENDIFYLSGKACIGKVFKRFWF